MLDISLAKHYDAFEPKSWHLRRKYCQSF